MGTNNRQRRAAKARKRSRRSSGQPSTPRSNGDGLGTPGGDPWGSFGDQPDDEAGCDCPTCQRTRGDAGRQTDENRWDDTADMLESTVALMWRSGWQPAELVRHVRRRVSREAAELISAAILADDRPRRVASTHPRWAHQIDGLRASIDPAFAASEWITEWAEANEAGFDVIGDLLTELATLGPLLRLIPPPGESSVDVGIDEHGTEDPILAKVRALLAQAESTSFPAEAETFTAKAQALMSRHAIDEAMIRDAASDASRPVTVRLPVDDPYVDEKSTLLAVVADAGRCRAIRLSPYAMSSVTGQASDVRRVELLFTSLLLQAQAALNHEAAAGGAGSHRRSRRYRAAFLAGYAERIGDRLLEERERAETAAGVDVLPVLARQSQAVDDEIERLFGGRLTSAGAKSRDRAGWNAGNEAADRARLRESGVGAGRMDRPRASLPNST